MGRKKYKINEVIIIILINKVRESTIYIDGHKTLAIKKKALIK